MTAIVDLYVDEILNAALDAGEKGKPNATAIARAVEKAYQHFRTTAGNDTRRVRMLLTELSESLRLAAQSRAHTAATKDLIQSGVVLANIYLSGLDHGSRFGN